LYWIGQEDAKNQIVLYPIQNQISSKKEGLCHLNFKSAHLLMDLNLKHAHPIFLRGYSLKLNGRFRLCLNYTNGLLQIR